ncbi:MAG: methionine synthase [Propionibacteriaceae bacterium]|jgi:5-methyltetrahydrofolate--homocysteine methyltransferase|nr:methionine synthase [Propionibacteriaceae bacterium]
MTAERPSLRSVLGRRILIGDGAMGTMLQRTLFTVEDFQGHEGCNEILSVTRPEVVSAIHRAYLEAGADVIETNTFGANLTALAEYGIDARIAELSLAGAQLAREAADAASTPGRLRWVTGSIGPGTKLPSLGQVSYAALRDGYAIQAEALLEGGVDGFQIETCQDLLQIRAAIAGIRRAAGGGDYPIIVTITLETGGTMLAGSSVGAVVATLEHLGVDVLGLNCGTGPDLMGEPLRELAASTGLTLGLLPNAGLPVLTSAGAVYPMGPSEFSERVAHHTAAFGLGLVGGCCGTTDEHIAALAEAVSGLKPRPPKPTRADAVASLYAETPLKQDTAFLAVGERTNASGSKAFREAVEGRRWDDAVAIAAEQVAGGAHVLDVCVDRVGGDGVADMAEVASRFATEVTIPLMFDSTNPEVLRTGLERAAGRSVVNSVHFEDGDGLESRFHEVMGLVAEHGSAVVALCIDEEGQARTAERKVAVARRLIETITSRYGLNPADIIVDCLTFPVATGQVETRRDALETLAAIRQLTREFPEVHTILGVSNVSFGLTPPARRVLNSVFLAAAQEAGLDAAIVHPSKILPMAAIPAEQREAAEALLFDRHDDGDPLERYLALFADTPVDEAKTVEERKSLPVAERIARHIIDGVAAGLEDDLDEALASKDALALINEDLLGAMRTVGERFGAGQMQLPFVLRSAEVMKKAVTHLEPHLDRADAAARGVIVLATVRGDVHDIGKNLVDIILTNNGYTVVNLGIKQPIAAIIAAAEEHEADAIGLSGLLVKSTQVMRENLLELNDRGLARRFPVLLGGAALTRPYVEKDLASLYDGDVFYARDAFEGLRLLDEVMAEKHTKATEKTEVAGRTASQAPEETSPSAIATTGTTPAPSVGDASTAISQRASTPVTANGSASAQPASREQPAPSLTTFSHPRDEATVGVGQPLEPADVPTPPFYGSRVFDAITLDDVVPWLDERALFAGRWGLTATADGPSYEELVVTEGRPRLKQWLDIVAEENLADFKVAWGYWPCWSDGDDLVLAAPGVPMGLSDGSSQIHGASTKAGALEGAGRHTFATGDVREPVPTGDSEGGVVARFHFPRQRRSPHRCLADYFRPATVVETEGPDVVALQLVTVGERFTRRTRELFAADRYRDYLELHGLSVQLAEALAELWHERIRRELGLTVASGPVGPQSQADPVPATQTTGSQTTQPRSVPSATALSQEERAAMIHRQTYRGRRYSFGYPACPDLSQRRALVDLLGAERIGVRLSGEYQLDPEQSTDALIVHHPEARYFSV